MREILFRGKRVDNGEWVTGDMVSINGETFIYCVPVISTSESGKTGRFGVSGYEVDPSTVGQYTGITDRKGNRIFEGDVIRFSLKTETTDCVVEWCDGGFVFRYVKIRAMGGDLVQSDADNAEIVRNVYDNADLLK
jgi:uncharacterized phage protein (TIGR01671 family)